MTPTKFPEATNVLLPPEGQEDEVNELPIWRHPEGGMVISKWQLSWREKLSLIFGGHLWFVCWGDTHPPLTLETRYPFEKVSSGWAIRSAIILIVLLVAFTVGLTGHLYFNGEL